MKIFNLPQDIYKDKEKQSDQIIFHYYSAPVGSLKGKSIMHKNAVSLVISGEKTMRFAEKTVRVNENEFHFLSQGNCIVSMKLPDRQIFRSILIYFDNKTLADFYLKYDKKITKILAKQKIAIEPYIAFKKDAFVINFIESLKLLFQSGGEISTEMKLLKFEELMLHLLENYPDRLLSFPVAKSRELNDFEIRKAVETNITNKISTGELAFLCNLTLSTFKRRFTKIYGTSPQKWFIQKRMELAKDLLQHHNEKPGEVFYKVGYENHSSFTQSFRQTYGMTPKEFQQRF